MKINMLPASYGDCLLIELTKSSGGKFTILIDGGTDESYDQGIKDTLETYVEEKGNIDLIIITHTDNDHIGGIYKILQNEKLLPHIGRVIFNSPYVIGKVNDEWVWPDLKKSIVPETIATTTVSKGFRRKTGDRLNSTKQTFGNSVNTSALKANSLQQILFNLDKLELELIINDRSKDIDDDGIQIQFLSPSMEELNSFWSTYKKEISTKRPGINTARAKSDYHIPFQQLLESYEMKSLNSANKASLAFIIKEVSSSKTALIMGDSSYQIVAQNLKTLTDNTAQKYSQDKPLKLDYLKLSHHGSICDLDKTFLELIECNSYLISTDGSNYEHPNKSAIAQVHKQFPAAKFYFNYEERIKEITAEGGIIKNICSYQREF